MKHIPLFVVLGLVLSLCNLSEKFSGNKSNSSTSSSANTNSGATGNEKVDRPEPTVAQTAAIQGGQPISWDQQGISWTLPTSWKKVNEESKMFTATTGNTAFLITSISPMGADFPTDVSLKAMYDGEVTRKKNGEVDELRYLEIDGLKGVQFRESKPEEANGIRRLQWMAYRKYAGQTQLVNIILSGNGDNFTKHQDELYAILYSMKITH